MHYIIYNIIQISCYFIILYFAYLAEGIIIEFAYVNTNLRLICILIYGKFNAIATPL